MKKGEFVKIHYTGRTKDGQVFDTTKEGVAKEEGFENKDFEPIVLCIGENMILPGLDDALEKHDDDFSATIEPEQAFGKKDPKLLQIIPTGQLTKQNITPRPGMQLNIDGNYGTVRRSGGGRTVVDFNHPLAGQQVTYDVEIVEKITSPEEQVRALLKPIGIEPESISTEGKAATIKLEQMLPQQALDGLQKSITKLTGLETISFEAGEKPENR